MLALARTTGGLEELDDEIRAAGGSASLIPLDLADGAQIEQLGQALAARFDKLDILVANAAVLGELTPVTDIAEKIWQAVYNINVTANWRLLKALDPLLRGGGAALQFTRKVRRIDQWKVAIPMRRHMRMGR